jgi:hypothetical protein
MRAYSGFKSEASSSKPKMLPAGPYVAKIKGVKIEGREPDQTLILRVDVCEGPYTNYFFNRYTEESKSSRYDVKYKGDYKLRIPNDENTKALYPESDIKRFNDAIFRIEKSNEGYHWDWNEQGLKGLTVGINMQEDEYNGYKYTKIGKLEIADDVRAGIVKPMEPKEKRGDADDSAHIDQQSGFVAVETDELPF